MMNCGIEPNNNSQHSYGREVAIWSVGDQFRILKVSSYVAFVLKSKQVNASRVSNKIT